MGRIMNRRTSWPMAAIIVTAAAIIGFFGGGVIGATSAGHGGADGSATPTTTDTPSPDPSPSEPATGLTLESAVDTVGAGERIDFTGTLEPPVSGIELQVERRTDGGDWEDFPVTVTTNNDGGFSTWIQTGRVGANEFRLTGTVEGAPIESNTVSVTIS